MTPVQALSPLILSLLLLASTSTASVLEDECKSFAASHADIGYDYCVSFFQADKKSATADKPGLAVAAVKITRAAAKNTTKRIAALEASATDKAAKECLSTCDELYKDTLGNLDEAAKGIASGKEEGLKDAVTMLSAALDVADTCEEGFSELGVASPLVNEDADFNKKASIALAVTASLSPPKK